MKKLSEQYIIDYLSSDTTLPSNIIGIGDDTAVIERDTNCELITKDLLIEDQHFRLRYGSPAQLARKALHVNLSDIAAMGGTPLAILLGLSIPLTLPLDYLTSFLTAFKEECNKANVHLIGGDTTHSPQGFIISITAIGQADKTHIKYRSGATEKNVLCLLGYAGDAHAGLLLLENNQPDCQPLKDAFLAPTALIEEGAWLGKQTAVTAMLDTSDGIYLDLKRLSAASQVGAILNIDTLPLSPSLSQASEALPVSPIECALIGGEDYGLLFTVQATELKALKESFSRHFNIPFTVIGVMTQQPGLVLQQNNKPFECHYQPFSHFHEEQ